MKHGLVLLVFDGAHAVHAAHVVDAVHAAPPAGDNVTFATPTIASRVTSAASSVFTHVLAPGWPFRQDQVTHFGGAVPHTYLHVVGQLEAEFAQHAARIDHRTRAIGRRLVPDGWQAEDRPRIARAQGAHDEVVDLGRILEDHHVLALAANVAELGNRGAGVGEQAFL